MVRFVYAVLLFLLASCTSTKEPAEVKEWLPSDSLSVEVGSPTLIKMAGGTLFVNHSFSGDYNLDAIDVANDSILYSFASKGQGPDEFLQIASMDAYRLDGKWFLSLFDNMKRECVVYSVDSLNRYKEKCHPVRTWKLPTASRYLEIYKLKDFYVATGRTARKYTILDTDSLRRIRTCADYLLGNEADKDSMTISKANYGRQYPSVSGEKMLSVVYMSGTLTQYEAVADSVRKVWEYTSSGFEYGKEGNSVYQQSPMGYMAADFMGNEVIGLYSGEEKTTESDYGKEFHLLDMEGRLLGKYCIFSNLYNFCVDSENGLIYAIAYDPDPRILIYDRSMAGETDYPLKKMQ